MSRLLSLQRVGGAEILLSILCLGVMKIAQEGHNKMLGLVFPFYILTKTNRSK